MFVNITTIIRGFMLVSCRVEQLLNGMSNILVS